MFRVLMLLSFSFVFVGCASEAPPAQPASTPTAEQSPSKDAKDSPGASEKQTDKTSADFPAKREFDFTYAASLIDVPAGAKVQVWIPVAETNGQQQVELTSLVPQQTKVNRDKKYGNQIGYFESKADGSPISIKATYRVERQRAGIDKSEPKLSAGDSQSFLSANKLVPVTGKPAELLADSVIAAEPVEAGKQLYQIVEQHMKYDKSKPGYGNGDAVWACDSKTGNCTDFHSLFISLARHLKIPAKFEIGFPLSTKPEGTIGGYHCWAWFHIADQGWFPVDISEADKHPEMKSFYCGNLTADRMSFSTGRDIELVPTAKVGTLNYFVYPHVEVDGKPWPKEKIKLDFSFKNKTRK